MINHENSPESKVCKNSQNDTGLIPIDTTLTPMKPQADPTKTDVYGMASDEQIRELLASGSISDKLRARLMREADRRAAPRRQSTHRTAVQG